jgi:hypothetical protein
VRAARVEVRGKPFVEVVLDGRGQRSFPVEVPRFPAATGFIYKKAVAQPPRALVSGPKTQVDKVSRVLASVEPARGDSTIRGAFALIAQDEERQTVPGVRVEPARALSAHGTGAGDGDAAAARERRPDRVRKRPDTRSTMPRWSRARSWSSVCRIALPCCPA